MAVWDERQIAQRIAQALQAVRRGEADTIDIRGSWAHQEIAQAVVADYTQGFGLEVVVTELPDGIRVEARNPSSRTIEIDLTKSSSD